MRLNNRCICLFLVFAIAGCAPAPLQTDLPAMIPTSTAPPAAAALSPTPAGAAPSAAVFTAASPTAVESAISADAVPTTAPSAEPEPAPAFQAGQWAFLFYHDGLEQVILVNGGPERGKPPDEPLELWSWDGAEWNRIETGENGPTWRNWAAAAFDPVRDVLVIHGGEQHRRAFAETWEWNGQSWKRFTGEGPGARAGALMAYDEARQRSVLFDGAADEIDAQTWEWDGEVWTLAAEAGPAARFPAGIVYDPVRQEILMFSGHYAGPDGEFREYDDLWAWDGASWRELAPGGSGPGHHNLAALVADPLTGQILLFSGGMNPFQIPLWAWDGEQWTGLETAGMPARSGHSVVFDAARDRYVFFSGVDRPGGRAIGDTWEWDGSQWICASSCP